MFTVGVAQSSAVIRYVGYIRFCRWRHALTLWTLYGASRPER